MYPSPLYDGLCGQYGFFAEPDTSAFYDRGSALEEHIEKEGEHYDESSGPFMAGIGRVFEERENPPDYGIPCYEPGYQ